MKKSIVNNIKSLCEEQNITIGELEKSLGFSQGLISRWDKNSPSIDKVLAVSDFFKVSLDYLFGKIHDASSTTLETLFIDKLLSETKNYSLNWKESNRSLTEAENKIFTTLTNIDGDKAINNITLLYELDYEKSRLYLFCETGELDVLFLAMQIDTDISITKQNTSLISTYSDFHKLKSLASCISIYLKKHSMVEKSHSIMKEFINTSITRTPNEPIPYSRIVNNCLTNLEGFVLDARMGKYFSDEILKIWNKIDQIEQHIK